MTRIAVITLAAISLAAAGPSTAAPLAVGGFYQETASADCSFGAPSVCTVSFTSITGANAVVVTDASCMVTMKSTNTLTGLYLRSATSGGAIIPRYTYLPPSFSAINGFQRQYMMQAKIGHGFPPGQRPQIVAETAGTSALFTMICTVAGALQR